MWTTRLFSRAINQWQMEPCWVVLIDFFFFCIFFYWFFFPLFVAHRSGKDLQAALGVSLFLAPPLSSPSCQGGRAALPAPIPGAGSGPGLEPSTSFGGKSRLGFKAGTSQLSQNPFLASPGPSISVLLIPDPTPSVPASPPLLQLLKWDFRDF